MKDQTGSLGCGYTLFGPFGIIFSLFSYDRNCPSCKRGLPGTATKCHHCHTEIQPTYPPKPKERPPEPKPEPEQKKEEPKQIECAFCGGKTTDQITCEKCGRNIENQKKYL